MRPARVRLIDLGLDDDFATSMGFAQSTIRSLTVTSPDSLPAADVEYLRTRDWWTVTTALQAQAEIIHVLAHGSNAEDEVGFWGADSEDFSLADMAEQFHADDWYINCAVLFADCCTSAQSRFIKGITQCLQQETLYIGATRQVNWHEGTTFASAFYASYFKDKGKGVDPVTRAEQAAQRAVDGYEAIVGGPCPYRARRLP